MLRRDRRYDGQFVYAATSTGIYCRPSCPARSPRRRNTVLFRTAGDAEQQGYVACLRCSPRSLLTSGEHKIKDALHYIDAHLDQPLTLRALSQVSGFSPHHFRETFQRIVGASPRFFCNACRISKFKQLLRAGESISSACYQAGFGSSRALYEKSRHGLGMTPALYQRGGKGVSIRFAIYSSPGGQSLVARTRLGVCAVRFGRDARALIRELRNEFPAARVARQRRFDRKGPILAGLQQNPLIAQLPPVLREEVLRARALAVVE